MSAERTCALDGCDQTLGDARQTLKYCCGAHRTRACRERKRASEPARAPDANLGPDSPAVTVGCPPVALAGCERWGALATPYEEERIARILQRHRDLARGVS